MKETLYAKLLHYIETLDINQLDEAQLHIAIGFFKKLFGFDD